MSSEDSSYSQPLLIVTSDFPHFDPDQLHTLTEYGYRVRYHHNASLKDLQSISDDIEDEDPFGIIAYGTPALHALHFATTPTSPALACVNAYYPPAIPTRTFSGYCGVKRVQIHLPRASHGALAGQLEGLVESCWERGVRVEVRWYWADNQTLTVPSVAEEKSEHIAALAGRAMGAEKSNSKIGPGFAEMARGVPGGYSRICADLALSRDLEALRSAGIPGVIPAPKGKRRAGSVEDIWQEFVQYAFDSSGDKSGPSTSGVVDTGMEIFLRCPRLPRSREGKITLKDWRRGLIGSGWRMLLVSCTVGVNRIVDEVVARFRWVEGLAWMLQGEEGQDEIMAELAKKAVGVEVDLGLVLVGEVRGAKVVGLRVTWDEGVLLKGLKDGRKEIERALPEELSSSLSDGYSVTPKRINPATDGVRNIILNAPR